MVAFLILGLIPGTDVQIDFTLWLLIMAGCIVIALLYPFRKKRLGLNLLVLLLIEFSTYRTKLALPA